MSNAPSDQSNVKFNTYLFDPITPSTLLNIHLDLTSSLDVLDAQYLGRSPFLHSLAMVIDGQSSTVTVASLNTNLGKLTTGTPAPSPTQVLVEISTSVLIQNYYSYYDGPIELFKPHYHALADGSLVSFPLTSDIRIAQVIAIVCGALCAFFIINIFTVLRYIRWGKVKNKLLFYILLASQVAGPFGIIPNYVGFFYQSADCLPLEILSEVFISLSMALMVTGIYGIKAYRCLNNSWVVLVGLVILRGLSTAMIIMDMTKITVERSLAGYCGRTTGSTLIYMVAQFIVQSIELFFISCCFFYALWKLHKVPATRGRLSISVTADSVAGSTKYAGDHDQRGWWDHERSGVKGDTGFAQQNMGFLAWIKSIWNAGPAPQNPPRKSSLHTQLPLSQTSRTARPRSGLPSSANSWRMSRILPRLRIYSQVLRNELVFTAAITAVQVTVAIPSAIGMYQQNTLEAAYIWSGVNWIVISLLTLHSFRRVVRRHDREAFHQQPAFKDPLNISERRLFDELQVARTRRPIRRHSFSSTVNMTSVPSSRVSYETNTTAQIRSRYYADSNVSSRAPSILTVDSGLSRSWGAPSVCIAPTFLGAPSTSLEPRWSNESMAALGSYTYSSVSDNSPQIRSRGEGWDPPPFRSSRESI